MTTRAAETLPEDWEKFQRRRQAVVTGGTNGVGFALAAMLGARGYDLILIGRDESRGRAASEVLAIQGCRAEFLSADLALMTEAERVAEAVANRVDRIDLLVQSAGSLDGGRRLTDEGIDFNFAVNFLARFALIEHLEPLLRTRPGSAESPAILFINGRVRGSAIRFADIGRQRTFGTIRAVRQYSHANDLLALGLHHEGLLATRGKVRVGCLKLGPVRTDIRRTFPLWMKIAVPLLLDPFLSQTPEEAARAAVDVLDKICESSDAGPLFAKIRKLRPLPLSAAETNAEEWRELFLFSHDLVNRARR